MINQFTYETIFTEKSFISPYLGYGGTVDWFAKISGFYMINDFKSSKRVYNKHLLQIGAYYNLMKEAGYEINGGSIILVNSKLCTIYPVNADDLNTLGNIFNSIYHIYKNISDIIVPHDENLLKKLKTSV